MRLPFHTTFLASALLLAAYSKTDDSTGQACSANGFKTGDLVDLTGDGVPDGKAVDVTGDCIPDGVDKDGNGSVDAPLPAMAPPAGDGDGSVGPGIVGDGDYQNPDSGVGVILPPTATKWTQDNSAKGGLDQTTVTALKN